MADLTGMLQAAAGNAGEEADEDFANTVLLLHGDGTNGAQNNTFLDSSTNNFTITRNGNTTQGTFSPFKPDGRWGVFSDGSGDYLSIADNAAFDVGTGDFTIECFVYHNNAATSEEIYCTHTTNGIQISRNSSGKFAISQSGVGSLLAGSTTLNAGTFYHVAAVRSGTDLKVYVDGVEDGSTTNSTNLAGNSTFFISANAGINGYLSNLRLVKGTAITPPAGGPTSPLTAVANTSLLTCQSNRFVDNSTNNFSISVGGGTPKVTPFSPFPITTAYDPSVNGGAGYFDGSGDYLSVASNAAFDLGTGAFTWEAWVYATSSSNTAFIHGISAGFIVNFASSKPVIRLFGVADLLTASDTLALNSWNHIAVARSGTTLSMWINGSRSAGGTVTDSSNFGQTGFNIGAINDGTAVYTGYMSSQRLVKGTAVYDPTQTTITVPTAPLTAIANTSLLCNFTNAGILDNTGFNALESVADVAINTTTKKYGTGSIEFDGTGDWLVAPSSENFAVSSGDFTIEFWIYLTANFGAGGTGLVSANYISNFHVFGSLSGGNNLVGMYVANSFILTSAGISLNTWTHIACVRSNGTATIYVDGVSGASGTLSGTGAASALYVGTSSHLTSETLTGLIDLRITKGVARYTTTFTPPDKAFPDFGE